MPQPLQTDWPTVWIAMAAGTAGAFQIGKLAPILPLLRADLDLSLIAGGWLATVINFVVAVGGLTLGLSADRLGRRRCLTVGLWVIVAGNLLSAVAPATAIVFLARAVEGIGYLLVIVSAPAIIVEASAPADLRITLAIWGAFVPFGFGLAMLTAPAVAAGFGWRGLQAGIAAALAAFAITAAPRIPATFGRARRDSGVRFAAAFRGAASRPGIWIMGSCFSLYALQWYAVLIWLPTIIVESTGLGPTAAGAAVAAVALINGFGNIAAAPLLARGVERWAILAGVAALYTVLTPFILSDSLSATTRLLLALIFSLIGGGLPGAIMAGVPRHAASPSLIGATNGLIMQLSNFGSLIGPPALAAVVTYGGGWQVGRGLLIAAALAGLAGAIALRQLERREDLANNGEGA